MASFQALCEVVNEFAKNESNNDYNNIITSKNKSLKQLLDSNDNQQATSKKIEQIKKLKKNPRYICNYCKSSWDKPSALEKHIRVHTNHRPYECKLCKLNFKTKSNLYKHCKSKLHVSQVSHKSTISTSINSLYNTIPINNNVLTSIANESSSSPSKIDDTIHNNTNSTISNNNSNNNDINNNNNNKIMVLTLPPGCVISLVTRPIQVINKNATLVINTDLKHKKPQVINLDQFKNQILTKSKLLSYLNTTQTSTSSLSVKTSPPVQLLNTFNTNKKICPIYLDGHNVPILNMLHTTFSFSYYNNNNTNRCSIVNNSSNLNNEINVNCSNSLTSINNLIYTNKHDSKLKLVHSSYKQKGLETILNDIGVNKNDLNNLLHLVPMHKSNLDKLIEPVLKTVSMPKPSYPCGRKVMSNDDFKYVRGKGKGRYECIECGIRTKKPSMLKKHIRSHSNLRPYICKPCDISFKTKGNLVKHMKTKAHIKKAVDTSESQMSLTSVIKPQNQVTYENIDELALKKQQEIEKRLIVKDVELVEAKMSKKNNLFNEASDKCSVETRNDDVISSDESKSDGSSYFFDSVQDVAKSLLNLSKISHRPFEENRSCQQLTSQQLDDIGHLFEPNYKLKMCEKEHSLSISKVMLQLIKNTNN